MNGFQNIIRGVTGCPKGIATPIWRQRTWLRKKTKIRLLSKEEKKEPEVQNTCWRGGEMECARVYYPRQDTAGVQLLMSDLSG